MACVASCERLFPVEVFKYPVLTGRQPYPVFPVDFINDLQPLPARFVRPVFKVEFDIAESYLQPWMNPNGPGRDKERTPG